MEFPCGGCIVQMVCKEYCYKLRPLIKKLGNCRYSECLIRAMCDVSVIEIKKLECECDYQGHIKIIAKCFDERIMSYSYYYGSCSGCDTWEAKNYNMQEIIEEMKREMAFFKNEEVYKKFIEREKE